MVVVEFPCFAYDSGSASQKNMQYRAGPAWGEVGCSEHEPKVGIGFPNRSCSIVAERMFRRSGYRFADENMRHSMDPVAPCGRRWDGWGPQRVCGRWLGAVRATVETDVDACARQALAGPAGGRLERRPDRQEARHHPQRC